MLFVRTVRVSEFRVDQVFGFRVVKVFWFRGT